MRRSCAHLLPLDLRLGALAAPSAQAKYVASFREIGSNVVESGGGTLDLTDLFRSNEFDAPNVPSVDPPLSDFFSGAASPIVAAYKSVSGPSGFGAGLGTFASFSGGDPVGLQASLLFVPLDYVSGAQLSETSTYLNASLASLGMTPGTYVWSWGFEDHADTFTLDIGEAIPPPVPELSTWAMVLSLASRALATLPFAEGAAFVRSQRKRQTPERAALPLARANPSLERFHRARCGRRRSVRAPRRSRVRRPERAASRSVPALCRSRNAVRPSRRGSMRFSTALDI